MKTKQAQKRLHLTTETIRSLNTADVENVVGGAAKGGGNGNGEAGFLDSISISWGGHNCCNCK